MRTQRKQSRGIALLLVVAVLALASALGFVMLSAATLQNRAGANQYRLATADYLAESGINLAMYYLQYSDRAPSLNSSGYWAGTGGPVTLSSSIDGTVNVTVTRDASDQWSYEIISVATAGTNADTKVTRTTGARVYVRNEYQIKQAGAFNGNVIIASNWTVQGDVWTSKRLSIPMTAPLPVLTGAGYCKTAQTGVGWMTPTGGFKAAPNANWAFVLNNDVTINGTLVVKGDLQIKGKNITITSQSNFPALIVTGTLEIYQSKNSLTVNGICFVGTTIKSNGSTPTPPSDTSTFNVNGAVIVGTSGGTPVTTPFTVPTVIRYDATKAKAPDLTCVQRVAKGVSIVRWGLP
jgi:Tfp pilus assembly protein PilX